MTGFTEGIGGLPLPDGFTLRMTGPVPAPRVAAARELSRTRSLPAGELTDGEIGNEGRAAGTTGERRAELAAEAEQRRVRGYVGGELDPGAVDKICAVIAAARADREQRGGGHAVSGLDVEAAGGITRAARLTEQEALRVEAEDLTARYGVTVYPARRRGQDGLTTEVDGVSVTGGVDEVRKWLKRHARCKAPAGGASPVVPPAGQEQ